MLVLNVSANHRYVYICTCHITFTLHVITFVSVKSLDGYMRVLCLNIFNHDIIFLTGSQEISSVFVVTKQSVFNEMSEKFLVTFVVTKN